MQEAEVTMLNERITPEVQAVLEQVQKSSPAITRALEGLAEIQNTGALDTLFELAEILHAAKQSMTDSMIHKVGVTGRVGLETMDVLMASGVADKAPSLLSGVLGATVEAKKKAEADRTKIGPLALLSALKEPEIQFMLKFVLNLARRLPALMQG